MGDPPVTADQNPSAYRVSAYRTRRDYLLGRPDYSQTVVDEPGKPPAAERADALWAELLRRSTCNRLGWRIVSRTPLTDPKLIRP